MKINLLNGPAFNTTACNTLITQACAEFQDKKHQKKPCSCQSVIKSKSISTQVSMKRSQIFQKGKLTVLYQVLKLKFPNMNQPKIQPYRTLIVSLIQMTTFVMQSMLLIVSRTSAAVLHTFINNYQCSFVLYFVPFSDYFNNHNYPKVTLTYNSHIFSFLSLFFTVKEHSTLRLCQEKGVC